MLVGFESVKGTMDKKKASRYENRAVRSLKEDLRIDKSNLPGEWEKQPEVYRYWAEEYAIGTMERDQAKDRLELVTADLDLVIRRDPSAYELTKPTESAVVSAIKQQCSYGEALDQLNKAKHEVNCMVAARDAMEHKRDALKQLGALAIAGFYSANTAPPESSVNKGQRLRQKFGTQQVKKQRRTLIP